MSSTRAPAVAGYFYPAAKTELAADVRSMLDAVQVASLGQISAALYEVGGQYRRNM